MCFVLFVVRSVRNCEQARVITDYRRRRRRRRSHFKSQGSSIFSPNEKERRGGHENPNFQRVLLTFHVAENKGSWLTLLLEYPEFCRVKRQQRGEIERERERKGEREKREGGKERGRESQFNAPLQAFHRRPKKNLQR